MTTGSHHPVGALRERMIEDMRVRGFVEKTRTDYIRHVRAFAASTLEDRRSARRRGSRRSGPLPVVHALKDAGRTAAAWLSV